MLSPDINLFTFTILTMGHLGYRFIPLFQVWSVTENYLKSHSHIKQYNEYFAKQNTNVRRFKMSSFKRTYFIPSTPCSPTTPFKMQHSVAWTMTTGLPEITFSLHKCQERLWACSPHVSHGLCISHVCGERREECAREKGRRGYVRKKERPWLEF